MTQENFDQSVEGRLDGERGGFVALAVIAAAIGAGAALLLAPEKGSKTRARMGQGLRSIRGEAAQTISQLQREISRKKYQSRRENRLVAVAGLLIGAGLAAMLNPESGPATRRRLGGTLSRIKVGTVDRIERLRARRDPAADVSGESEQVRTVQELGRDPNSVF